jgi:hypothetical protein
VTATRTRKAKIPMRNYQNLKPSPRLLRLRPLKQNWINPNLPLQRLPQRRLLPWQSLALAMSRARNHQTMLLLNPYLQKLKLRPLRSLLYRSPRLQNLYLPRHLRRRLVPNRNLVPARIQVRSPQMKILMKFRLNLHRNPCLTLLFLWMDRVNPILRRTSLQIPSPA